MAAADAAGGAWAAAQAPAAVRDTARANDAERDIFMLFLSSV
jgi:hypothetical protein